MQPRRPRSPFHLHRSGLDLFDQNRFSQFGSDAHAAIIHLANEIALMRQQANHLLLEETNLPQSLGMLLRRREPTDSDGRPGADSVERAKQSALSSPSVRALGVR